MEHLHLSLPQPLTSRTCGRMRTSARCQTAGRCTAGRNKAPLDAGAYHISHALGSSKAKLAYHREQATVARSTSRRDFTPGMPWYGSIPRMLSFTKEARYFRGLCIIRHVLHKDAAFHLCCHSRESVLMPSRPVSYQSSKPSQACCVFNSQAKHGQAVVQLAPTPVPRDAQISCNRFPPACSQRIPLWGLQVPGRLLPAPHCF